MKGSYSMSKVKRLAENYARHIKVPWRDDAAAPQRVIFCVYHESEELRLRAKIDEFEIATKESGHDWRVFDLTETFGQWLSSQKYAKSYFKQPQLITPLLPKYRSFIVERFGTFLEASKADGNAVVALKGVGSLFGLLKVKDVVDDLAPKVAGRLLVFFPGSFENNNYRLLDGYDGWNYLAVPITSDTEL